jgi:hypothetical protein
MISLKVRNETKIITLSTPSFGIHNQSNKIEDIIGIQVDKEKVKLSPFAYDMIIYLQNLSNSIKKLLHTLKSFSKITGYKINLKN